jgi:hypothetical protein
VSDSLVITSDVQAAMRRVVDDVERVTHEEIVASADDALGRIRATWPVDTGTSRAAFRAAEEPYGASVRCSERYAGFVHGGKAEARAIELTVEEVHRGLARAAARVTG